MYLVKAPDRMDLSKFSSLWPRLFLAGSIEMGAAENWQDKITAALQDKDVVLFNPRRDDWNSSWEQSINNPAFHEQVCWELDHLESCDLILMYFDPNTKSPISLLELGLFAAARKLIVCCPAGFWRRGNVEIVCKRYGILTVPDLDILIKRAVSYVEQTGAQNE